ncbi:MULTISPECIES: restriction endonuclease subunit S [unclassified Acinetobacter]|uniref:restriction endonuclease subunit S n=1 Tax=unclassified Acinetobacter TaxID=196816 RepID=UPI0015D34E43|nr:MULTISPECIES: restriction endonuclease subunit S [unclassified Acinetobacter]
MSKWPISSLKGLIQIKHGYPFKSEFFSAQKTKYIVLTPGNFYEEGGFKRQEGKEKFYTGEVLQDYLHKKGDLIVAMTEQAAGLLGSCARVPESGIYLHNQRLGLITTDPKKILKDYLYHLFKTKTVREQIRLTSSGSKVKHTSPERIYEVQVPLPDVNEQQKIVNLLDALEDKVELNKRIKIELDDMAKTLYDYWFVQFDFPDSNGNPYKTSGGKMVYNSNLKRNIPEGWEDCKLEKIINIHDSKRVPLSAKQRDLIKGNIPYYGATSIMGYVNDYIFDGEYVLLAEDGSVMDMNGFPVLQYIYGKTWVNNHAHVLEASSGFSNPLLHLCLKKIPVINMMSGSIQKKINQDNLRNTPILLPPIHILEAINPILKCIYEKSIEIQKENVCLDKLRNWLLPMLMNGQISIRDTEEHIAKIFEQNE